MDMIELKIEEKATQKNIFDPDFSLIVGLPQADNEDLMAKVEDLLHEGLDCDPVPDPVAVEHIRIREPQPGLVKVELRSYQTKWLCSAENLNLRAATASRVFVSSAKLHTEPLF